MKKLLWLSIGFPAGPLAENASHYAASLRYRLTVPARALAALGVHSDIANPEAPETSARFDFSPYMAMIVGKYSHHDPSIVAEVTRGILSMVAAARRSGIMTIADVCDDRFDDVLLGDYWRQLLSSCDRVVASTTQLADVARPYAAQALTIIPDPVEGPGAPPKFAPPPPRHWLQRMLTPRSRALELLWFGHQSNLDEVQQLLPRLARWVAAQSSLDKVNLTLVTAPDFGAETLVTAYAAQASRLRLRFIPWSPPALQTELNDCDMVLLPATLEKTQKQVKSANRLTESLWAGRAVFAHPVPSYLAFMEHAWISEDIFPGMSAALRNPSNVTRQIEAGQDLIRREYSAPSIARRWMSVIQS